MLKALALENFWAPVFSKTKITSSKAETANNRRFYLVLCLIITNAVLLAGYIYGVNAFASKGYEIKTLQKRLDSMNEENRKINLKVSEAGSMVSIQSGFLNANFVSAGTPKFLEINSSQFTQR